MKTMNYNEYRNYMDNLPRCATFATVSPEYGEVAIFTKWTNPLDELLFDEPTPEEITEGEEFVKQHADMRIRFDKETEMYQILKRESKEHEAVVSAISSLVGKIKFENENWI